jgi:hypothetical protein
MRAAFEIAGIGKLENPKPSISSWIPFAAGHDLILWCIGGSDAADETQNDGIERS